MTRHPQRRSRQRRRRTVSVELRRSPGNTHGKRERSEHGASSGGSSASTPQQHPILEERAVDDARHDVEFRRSKRRRQSEGPHGRDKTAPVSHDPQAGDLPCSSPELAVDSRSKGQREMPPPRKGSSAASAVHPSNVSTQRQDGAAPPTPPPLPATTRVETVEDRRLLTRLFVSPSHLTTSTSSVNHSNSRATNTAAVLADHSSGVLGSGAAPMQRPVLSPAPAQRPPTPSLLPTAITSVSSAHPRPSPLSSLAGPTAVPFVHADYMQWLCAAPANNGDLSSHFSTQHTESGAVVSSAASSALDRQRDLSVHAKHSPTADAIHSSPPLRDEDIAYDRDFAVSTEWAAVLAAPPLVASGPRMPSLYADQWQPEASDAVLGDGGTTSPPLPPLSTGVLAAATTHGMNTSGNSDSGVLGSGFGVLSSPLPMDSSSVIAGETASFAFHMANSQGSFDAPWLSATPLAAPHLHDARPAPMSKEVAEDLQRELHASCVGGEDGADEGLRVFVKHFHHGKVHTRPPWFLCSALLNNCEHPHYLSWLDELQLGSVEEELARARKPQGGVLGDQ